MSSAKQPYIDCHYDADGIPTEFSIHVLNYQELQLLQEAVFLLQVSGTQLPYRCSDNEYRHRAAGLIKLKHAFSQKFEFEEGLIEAKQPDFMDRKQFIPVINDFQENLRILIGSKP